MLFYGLCGALRVCVNSSFLGLFDDLEKSTCKGAVRKSTP